MRYIGRLLSRNQGYHGAKEASVFLVRGVLEVLNPSTKGRNDDQNTDWERTVSDPVD